MSSTLNDAITALKKCARDFRNGDVELNELKRAAKTLMIHPEYGANTEAKRIIDAAKKLVKEKTESGAETKSKIKRIEEGAVVLSIGKPSKLDTAKATAATFRSSLCLDKHGEHLFTFFSANGKKYYVKVFELGGNKYVSLHGSWHVQAKTGPSAVDLFKKVHCKGSAAADLFADLLGDVSDPLAEEDDATDPFACDPFASPSASAEGGARAMSGGGASGGGASGGGGDGSAAEKATLPISYAAKHRSLPFLQEAIGAAFDCDDFDLAQSLEAEVQATKAKVAEYVDALKKIPEVMAVVEKMGSGLSEESLTIDFLTKLLANAREANTTGLATLGRLKALHTPLPKDDSLPPVKSPVVKAQELKDKIAHAMTTACITATLQLETLEEVKATLRNDSAYKMNDEVRGLLFELGNHYKELAKELA